MTDILNIIRSFELSPAAGIGIESVDRARQIVGRQLGGVLIGGVLTVFAARIAQSLVDGIAGMF